jgi:DNA-binding NarL/FixJ family response regulator
MEREMSVKILIADGQTLFRQCLAYRLADAPGLEVVALAADGAEAARLAVELAPQVAIMDVVMPGMDGVEATRRIAALAPETRVAALSMRGDAAHVEAMLNAGATGYALKDDAFEELVEAIRAVAGGGRWLSPRLRGMALGARFPLSDREIEVVRLLAEGAGYKEIAARLGVGVKTVETYRLRAARKLGARSVPELVGRAIAAGMLRPE